MMDLIPVPFEYKEGQGYFEVTDGITVKSDFKLPAVCLDYGEGDAFVISKNTSLDEEEYKLNVSREAIKIEASCEKGAYYALQSLRQLSRYECGKRRIPCVDIHDKPRFKWRGLQLDESRHFFGVVEVKRLLDLMAMMKLNVFHWHLTDDPGWRIEIKKFPRLTEIGSKREYTQINGWHTTDIINEEYSGFYTQEQIKEIISYADERGIMIVPEIDFPAHCASAIAAYQHLACRELDRGVPGYFGGAVPERVFHQKDWNRTLCLGKESTFEFVFGVLDEVCELFPAPYLHIGGDEAPINEWKACPACQKAIKDNGLDNEYGLHGWFNNRILEYLKSKGKRLIGWNEILKSCNLDKSVIAQYWTPERDKNAEKHANSGGSIIMSNHQAFYFDMPYGKYPLKNTYSYSPEKFGVNKENEKNVLGIEGECWTEWIDGREKLDLNLFPRIQCLAEVAWSPKQAIDWNGFLERLDRFKSYYEVLDINYAVDKISMPTDLLQRARINYKFMNGDTHLEVKLNKKYLAKGER